MKNKTGKNKKPFLITISVVALLIAGFIFLLFLGDRISGNIIKELVKDETNGQYELQYTSVDLNVFKNTLVLSGLSVGPSDSIPADSSRYEIHVDSISLSLESILDIYLNRELSIKDIQIVHPDVLIDHRGKEGYRPRFTFEAGTFYNKITYYLKKLEINKFKIHEGSFTHYPTNFHLDEIDFTINNFLIDTTGIPDKVFYSESIELEIGSQAFLLPDSVHIFSFARFRLSTKDSLLRIFDSRIRERDIIPSIENPILKYDIYIPKISVKGIDYLKAYQENVLDINQVRILDSEIGLTKDLTINSFNDGVNKTNSINKLLVSIFDAININRFELDDASMNMSFVSNSLSRKFTAQKTDLDLINIHLDTSNYEFDRKHTYFQEAVAEAHNYSFMLEDGIHLVGFETMRFSTFDSTLSFNNLTIKPDRAIDSLENFYKVNVPYGALKGIHLVKALAGDVLQFDYTEIVKPDITIRSNKSRSDRIAPSQIRGMLTDYFTQIKGNQIEISEGAFRVPGQVQIGNFNLKLKQIKLDPFIKKWKKTVREIDFVGKDTYINTKPERIYIRKIIGHKELNNLFCVGVRSVGNKKTSIKADSLCLFGLHLDSLSKSGLASLDSIKIVSPDIAIFKSEMGQNKGFDLFHLPKRIKLTNGSVSYHFIDETMVSLKGINASFSNENKLKLYEADAENIIFLHPKSGTSGRLDSIKLDPDKQELNFYRITIDQDKEDWVLNVPVVSIVDIKWDSLFAGKGLIGEKARINSPGFKGTIPLDKLTSRKINKEAFPIRFDSIELSEGELNARFSGEKPGVIKVAANNISSELKNFYFPENSAFSDDHVLFSDQYSFSIQNFSPEMKSGDSLYSGSLTASSVENKIDINNILFKSSDRSINLISPKISVTYTAVSDLFNGDSLLLKSINVQRPILDIFPGLIKNEKKFEEKIHLGQVSIENGITNLWNKNGDTLSMHHRGNIVATDLKFDSNFAVNTHIGTLNVKGDSIYKNLGKVYFATATDHQLSYFDSKIKFENINLYARYDSLEYTTLLDYQKDWFNYYADSIVINGIDKDQWASDSEFLIEKAGMYGVFARVFRDKRLPFPPDQSRMMPRDLFYSLKPVVHLDTFQLTGTIAYTEIPENANRPATMTFDDMNGYVYNITTREELAKDSMRLEATGKLVDNGKFNARVGFDMHSPEAPFVFRGRVWDFDLTSMNKILRLAGNVNITSGYSSEVKFYMEGNNDRALGYMYFRYRKLGVQILNPETHDTKGLGQGIKTFFANTFTVRKNNPGFLFLRTREGRINYGRDKSRSVFNFWGKSLLMGVVTSVGVNRD